jgi:hypothetical protein
MFNVRTDAFTPRGLGQTSKPLDNGLTKTQQRKIFIHPCLIDLVYKRPLDKAMRALSTAFLCWASRPTATGVRLFAGQFPVKTNDGTTFFPQNASYTHCSNSHCGILQRPSLSLHLNHHLGYTLSVRLFTTRVYVVVRVGNDWRQH